MSPRICKCPSEIQVGGHWCPPERTMVSPRNLDLGTTLPERMKKIHSKMKALEWSQQIFHCKYMQIFTDAQGQLTSQSDVGSA